MSKELSTKGAVLAIVFQLAFLFIFIQGIIHSYRSHSKIDFFFSFFPPWGVVRGVEKYTHKSEINKSNDVDVKRASTVVLYIMSAMPETDEERKEFDKIVREAPEKIKSLPQDTVREVKKAAEMYARFLFAAARDMKSYFVKASKNEVLPIKWATECRPIMDSLIKLYGISDLESAYWEMDENMTIIRRRSKTSEQSLITSEDLAEVDRFAEKEVWRMRDIYRRIFKEEPNY